MSYTYNLVYLILVLSVGAMLPVSAQVNVLGKPGHILTPSAQWDTLRQVGVTFAFLPDNYAINNFIKDHRGPEQIYGVRFPITKFLEINLNFTRKPKIPDRIGVGDRHIDLRVHLVKERKIFPSLVLVVTPPEGVGTFLSQDFIVATKNLSVGDMGRLRFSGGYASPYFYQYSRIYDNRRGFRKKSEMGNYYLSGFFGSFQWQPWEFIGVMVEHDSQRVNSGVFVQWKERIFLQGNLYGNRELGATTSVRFPLDFSPFELRRFSRKNNLD